MTDIIVSSLLYEPSHLPGRSLMVQARDKIVQVNFYLKDDQSWKLIQQLEGPIGRVHADRIFSAGIQRLTITRKMNRRVEARNVLEDVDNKIALWEKRHMAFSVVLVDRAVHILVS